MIVSRKHSLRDHAARYGFLPFLAIALCAANPAAGQDVVVRKPAAGRSSMDWSAFEAPDTREGRVFLETLRASLVRSGWFAEARPGAGEFRLTGRARERRGELEVSVDVRSVGRAVISQSYRGDPAHARLLGHRVSDDIVQAVTGRPGFASTRLALVGNRTGNKELYLADSDGGNVRQLTRDNNLSLYPRWSPDGRHLVYTGYLQGFADLFQIELATGQRRRISSFPGLNTGGAISPDGRSMALILSRDGNPELYVRDLRSGELTRLTRTPRAVESSPSWSPDGERIAFVSDRPGAPHLYVISRRGGEARRLTTRGRENVAPHWGPAGEIVYATRVGDAYQLAVLNPDTMESRALALPPGDWEDPTWARDGRHVAAARRVGRRTSIWLVDTMTAESVVLISPEGGGWFSPAWSP